MLSVAVEVDGHGGRYRLPPPGTRPNSQLLNVFCGANIFLLNGIRVVRQKALQFLKLWKASGWCVCMGALGDLRAQSRT
jgi:hypothetical protein